jgi:hypothetical protein
MSLLGAGRRVAESALIAAVTLAVIPATASAHLLTGRYESPLPLAAYLGGAAVAVALSFAIVILRGRRGGAASEPASAATASASSQPHPIPVPRLLRTAVRAVGLLVWLWIVVQGIVGGVSSDADVGSLFLWTYAWVGLPLISAFVGPIWEWLDPFATLHDLGAALLRRLGARPWRIAVYPAAAERWPAVVAMAVFIWLELVYTSARGGRVLTIALLVYTVWTLAMMAQFGRDTWRRNGEAFTVWLGILNRMAPLAPVDERATVLRRRPLGAGLLEATWLTSELAFVAVGTASILFDGLSQTQPWFDLFGTPSLPAGTIQLIAFLAMIAGLVLLVARVVGRRAMAAGLVPIALGYLIAHYFTALAFDGQRIVNVLSDPFNVGWNLFGGATFEPNDTYIPFGIVWAIELVAVVGGHIYGAVMGHRAAVEPPTIALSPAAGVAPTKAGRKARPRPTPASSARMPTAVGPMTSGAFADVRVRQVPLAVLMVFLTTLTLWSLGQNLVHTSAEPAAAATTVRG